jgi:nanoRNase/pAp phosphatase (c-di-AMP/oligoRNAs hydrolase)
MSDKKYRLVTRSDFDGLACAILLNELNLIDDIKFVHPKDMQDGKVEITNRDITTNLPYVAGAHLVFDHHASETVRNAGGERPKNYIIYPGAPSAARVVYECYGGASRFPHALDDMMIAVDKGDAAEFSVEEILEPDRLGAAELPDGLAHRPGSLPRVPRQQLPADDGSDPVRAQPHDRRSARPAGRRRARGPVLRACEKAKEQIRRCTTVHGNLAVLDLRHEETIFAVNRFMIYALFPDTNISIHVMWGVQKQNTVFATGKSITNRSSRTNIGDLMLQYGGGGHENAGTCQIPNDQADAVLRELITRINADG